MRHRLLAGLVTVFSAVVFSQANAQDIPTVTAVSDDLNTSCGYSGGGVVTDIAGCLEAVDRAIATAGAYALAPQVPPQVDIGALLCALLIERPSLASSIIAKIDLSGNGNLALGCSNALGPAWIGPRPIISPA